MRTWQKVTLFVGASIVHFVLSVLTLVRIEICDVTYRCTLLDRAQCWLLNVPSLWIVTLLRRFKADIFTSIPVTLARTGETLT